VLGSKLQDELFGATNPIGQRISIGGETFRIIGVMHSKGQVLGFDIDDTIYIPAAKALEMFNRDSLMEIDILYRAGADADAVAARVKELLIARHGKEDFTITTQQQMLEVLDKVLGVLTFAVAALGGISLVVGGVGILTIMTIAVRERTSEIGLLRALGAQRRHVLLLFLGEATVLAALGGAAGMAVGIGGAYLLHLAVPALPVKIAWDYALIAEVIAALIGMAAGVMPARRAAHLDPVEALRAE
jgi:putative ABC transport system permease protein